MPFDPNKPFETEQSTRSFDPNKPFETEDSEQSSAPEETQPQYEAPGLARRLYEQNVVIPVRAARHLAPFPETIQKYAIDPVVGMFTDETGEEREKKRKEYDRYLDTIYPQAREAYETRAQMAGGLIKGAIPYVRAVEPLVEQAVGRPESLGANPETILNTANFGISAALATPKATAQSLAFIKARPEQRQSLKTYIETPRAFDEYEASTGGKPVRALEEEVQTNLEAREKARDQRIADATDAYNEAKTQEKFDVKQAIEDTRTKTQLGTADGDAMIQANKDLQEAYAKTAAIRNKVLEDAQAEIDINHLKPLFQNAYKTVYSTQDREAILNAWKEIQSMARRSEGKGFDNVQIGQAPMVISARELDRMRQIYQKQVDYTFGAHNQPYQWKLNAISNDINDILDASIPGNHPLRKQIQAETIRFKKANELFGSEYPLAKFQSAIKDPMKRRDIENLNIPSINDLLKTMDYRAMFERDLKLGIQPQVPSSQQVASTWQGLEEARSVKLPMSSRNAPSAIESAMMETYRNPKLNAQNAVQQYAEQIHPQGQADFMQKLNATKVLRDVEGINTAQGSRMTKLGSQLGAGAGAVMGMVTDNKLMTPVLAGMGAAAGASLDTHASGLFRGASRMAESARGAQSAMRPLTLGANVPIDRLVGTKYESIANEQDPKKQAILHYVMSSRDPEYAELVKAPK